MPNPFLEAAAVARHDLGKYIAFETRWVGESASGPDLLSALQADLLRTRSANGIEVDAVSLWQGLRVELEGLGDEDIDLEAVDRAMERIGARLPALRQGGLELEALKDCVADAFLVSQHLDALFRRLKEE